jgi:uncharacterized protein (TIGR03435 family)
MTKWEKHCRRFLSAASALLLVLAGRIAPGQSLQTQPAAAPISAPATAAFDVADIHASPFLRDVYGIGRDFSPKIQGGGLSGDRYIVRQTTMTKLIAAAYNMGPNLVEGGPSWLDWDRFDIEAKAPPTASKETLRLMLQSLLAQRFSLVVHNGTVSMPAYVLTAQNGNTKLKEADASGVSNCKPQPMTAPPAPGVFPQLVVVCRNETMMQFAEYLHSIAQLTVSDTAKPFIDSTGVEGAYDFDLRWTPAQLLGAAGSDGISIYDALNKQLGLKLALETAPQPVLIVDSVNEAPTPNPPDLAKRMPPLPLPQFEVATIKPAQPDERISSAFLGDREDWRAITIKAHIDNIFDINYNDNESIVGAPKWLGEERFDILAKLPGDDSGGATPRTPQLLQVEQRQRLLALLEDRLKMKYHLETGPVTAYNLVAASPKLTPADPKARTRCDEGPGPDGKDPRIKNMVLNRLVSCQNMSMAQFGVLLQYLAPDYIFSPVLDTTGLKGSYNFTLSFSSNFLLTAHIGGPSPDGAQQAEEPIGAVSLIDAVKNQLGLKLDKQKRPLPVLVIDHIEEPSAN